MHLAKTSFHTSDNKDVCHLIQVLKKTNMYIFFEHNLLSVKLISLNHFLPHYPHLLCPQVHPLHFYLPHQLPHLPHHFQQLWLSSSSVELLHRNPENKYKHKQLVLITLYLATILVCNAHHIYSLKNKIKTDSQKTQKM